MLQEDLLLLALDRIEALRIPYMLTGSVAVSYYGVPRTTHDVDLVVEMYGKQVAPLIEAFKRDFYASDEGVVKALHDKSMFNLIHHETGFKLDFWIVDRNVEYHRTRFERRAAKDYFGRKIVLISAEDLILTKLLWTKDFPSERHSDDIRGIILVQRDELDREFLQKWGKQLSVLNELLTFLH